MTSLQSEGAGKAGSAERTRSRVCSVESTRLSHHRFAGNPRPSLRNGFNGFLRALLGEPGLLSPSQAAMRSIVARLISASGYQDHTTSPSAALSFVFRHRCVHRLPRQRFVTIAKRPSLWARDAKDSAGDLGGDQPRDLRRIGTTGKSVEIGKFVSSEQQLLRLSCRRIRSTYDVVPAQAGTHTTRPLLRPGSGRLSANNNAVGYGSLASAGTTMRRSLRLTPLPPAS